MIAGMGWALDKRFDHLEDYINKRISDVETELERRKK